MNDFLIYLQARLDEVKSRKSLNKDIAKLQNKLNKIELQADVEPEIISKLTKEQEVVIEPRIELDNAKKEQEQLISGFEQISELWGELGEDSQDKLLENLFGESHTQISSVIELLGTLRESVNSMKDSHSGGWMLALGVLAAKLGASDIFKNIGKAVSVYGFQNQ